MKKILLLISFIFLNYSFSQKKGIIYYGYVESLYEGSGKGFDYNAYTIYNNKQSYYVTAKDSLESADKKTDKFIPNDAGGGTIAQGGLKRSKNGDQVVYNIKENIILSSILIKEQLYISETATKFNWKFTNETKKVGKLMCKKATTSFRGRDYTAWYTTSIPLPFGPWKLNGLPGLILEAYDTDKFVYWYFKNMEYPTKNKENVNNLRKPINSKSIKLISINDFYNFQKEFIEKAKDRNKILQKQYTNVTFDVSPIKEIFVEFE